MRTRADIEAWVSEAQALVQRGQQALIAASDQLTFRRGYLQCLLDQEADAAKTQAQPLPFVKRGKRGK